MANTPTKAATSFTFNGSTVVFSQTQQDTLDNDIKNLNDAVKAYNDKNVELSGYNAQVNDANSKLHGNNGVCGGLSQDQFVSCEAAARAQYNMYFPKQQVAQGQLNAILDSINNSTTGYLSVYNNDLNQIQNSIKLQIQASQANQATANQNTQNSISISTNTAANAVTVAGATPSVIEATNLNNAVLAQNALQAQTSVTEKTRQYMLIAFVFVVLAAATIIIFKVTK